MNWKVIYDLYVGFLGKALLIIALATPVSFLVKVGFSTFLFTISLVGAIFTLIGYLWAVFSTPEIIKNFSDGHDYAVKLNELKSSVDWVSEFKVLEENKSEILQGYDGYMYHQYKFDSIDSAKSELGEEQSLRSLSILKYNMINNFNIKQRWGLTVLFLLGSIFIYLPLVYRVFVVLGVVS
ncbi:hypothetical protein AB6C82_05190 [Vibrio splendidus]